jgi:hypothetical protein
MAGTAGSETNADRLIAADERAARPAAPKCRTAEAVRGAGVARGLSSPGRALVPGVRCAQHPRKSF